MIQTVITFQQKWQPHKKLSVIDQFKFDQSWENPNMYENGNINGHSIVVDTDIYFTKTKFLIRILIDQKFPFRKIMRLRWSRWSLLLKPQAYTFPRSSHVKYWNFLGFYDNID